MLAKYANSKFQLGATPKDIIIGVERELKEQIGDLRTEMKAGIAELKGLVKTIKVESENRTLKQFIVFWVVVAGIVIPILSTAFTVAKRHIIP